MNALIGFGLGLAIGLAGALNASETIIGCLIGVLIVYCFVVLVPSLSLSVRRLRDAGFHWAFIFLFCPNDWLSCVTGSLLLTDKRVNRR